MKILVALLFLFAQSGGQIVFDFTASSNLANWRIVDDVVMGGRSDGNLIINEDGHGLFYGDISLENYGGFSSARYTFDAVNVSNYSKIRIRLKGDGKKYQVRIKASAEDYYSYKSTITTNGEWEVKEINLADMYPTFRGRTLDMSNFDAKYIEEITILIGNKKEENFQLLLDKIELL